jgi:hypothetical protein
MCATVNGSWKSPIANAVHHHIRARVGGFFRIVSSFSSFASFHRFIVSSFGESSKPAVRELTSFAGVTNRDNSRHVHNRVTSFLDRTFSDILGHFRTFSLIEPPRADRNIR